MSHPAPAHAGDVRARAHIKALVEAMKEQAEGAPEPVQSFVSGLLSGLVASVEILDGGTAEKSLEAMEQRLAAAIGKAYLDGKLPAQQPADNVTSPEDATKAAETFVDRQIAAGIQRCDEAADRLRATLSPAREQIADAIRNFPFDDYGLDDLSYALENTPETQEWVSVLAAAVLDVVLPITPITAGLARDSEATVQRVIALNERWVKAGAPPLGTSMARWWDRRLLELCAAINGPADQPGSPS